MLMLDGHDRLGAATLMADDFDTRFRVLGL